MLHPTKGAKTASPGTQKDDPMTNIADHQEQLVLRVEASAAWRASKAEHYPDDKRNARSSQALTKLGRKLKMLPADNKCLGTYAAVIDRAVALRASSVLSDVSEDESEYIGRYGFDYRQEGDPEAFLDGLTDEIRPLIEAAEEEIAEEKREAEYEAAKEAADETAKEAAHKAATETAEAAAKAAAEEAYKEAYEETYKETYEEAYREVLLAELEFE